MPDTEHVPELKRTSVIAMREEKRLVVARKCFEVIAGVKSLQQRREESKKHPPNAMTDPKIRSIFPPLWPAKYNMLYFPHGVAVI
jgi:hypothetical protein